MNVSTFGAWEDAFSYLFFREVRRVVFVFSLFCCTIGPEASVMKGGSLFCLKDEQFLVLFPFSSIHFWFFQGPFLGRGMGRGRALAPPPGLQALSWEGGCCKADWMFDVQLAPLARRRIQTGKMALSTEKPPLSAHIRPFRRVLQNGCWKPSYFAIAKIVQR